jgi:hypothetical protein
VIGATCACRESVYGLLPLFAPRDSSGRIPISRPELRVVSNPKFEMQPFEFSQAVRLRRVDRVGAVAPAQPLRPRGSLSRILD